MINTDTKKYTVELSDITSWVLGSAAPQDVARLTNEEAKETITGD